MYLHLNTPNENNRRINCRYLFSGNLLFLFLNYTAVVEATLENLKMIYASHLRRYLSGGLALSIFISI